MNGSNFRLLFPKTWIYQPILQLTSHIYCAPKECSIPPVRSRPQARSISWLQWSRQSPSRNALRRQVWVRHCGTCWAVVSASSTKWWPKSPTRLTHRWRVWSWICSWDYVNIFHVFGKYFIFSDSQSMKVDSPSLAHWIVWGFVLMMKFNQLFTGTTTSIPMHAQARCWPNNHQLDTQCESNVPRLCWNILIIYHLPPISSPLPALPIEVLQADWWVPGSTSRADSPKFQGKLLFKEVLATSIETCRTWIERATQDTSSTNKLSGWKG